MKPSLWPDKSKVPEISESPVFPFNWAVIDFAKGDPSRRRRFVESKAYQVKKGDGLDFCHAVMGSAFASVATLDKHWKRRVEGLPKPNGLARIYSGTELGQMVTDIEWVLKNRPSRAEKAQQVTNRSQCKCWCLKEGLPISAACFQSRA
jgi:hypothetical protein